MRASTEECIAVCSAGPDVCLGINWLPLNPEPTRCMLQALAKTPQAAVEAAVGAKMNWWWAQGTATEGPPVKALDHGNGDWTASASCWVRASFATGGGLGWSFVLLLLLSAAGYLSVGAALARRGGRGQRWPHEPFWRELRALVADGWAFTITRGRGRSRRQGQGGESGGGRPRSGSEGRAEGGRPGRGRKEEKGRKGEREKASRRRERGGASDAGAGAGAPLLPNESGQSAEPARAGAAAAAPVADGTAAGDGGRWVRVPNG